MNTELLQGLIRCETDLDGVRSRFYGNESLYVKCLAEFLSDNTVDMLSEALDKRDWDEVFTAAHALKGLAGNMGFVPLFHSTAEFVLMVRAGRIAEIPDSYQSLRRCYDAITSAIRTGLNVSAS